MIFLTGLSDFHKLFLSVFKTAFPKSKPKEITYRNFKKFSEETINQELTTLCIFRKCFLRNFK